MYSTVRRFEKVKYDTLRLPQKVVAEETDGSVKFGQREGSAYLFDPDIYTDGRISVQGIDGVLFPPEENKPVPKSVHVAKVVSKPRRGMARGGVRVHVVVRLRAGDGGGRSIVAVADNAGLPQVFVMGGGSGVGGGRVCGDGGGRGSNDGLGSEGKRWGPGPCCCPASNWGRRRKKRCGGGR